MRKHRKEIIRFANSEDDTGVWLRYYKWTIWVKTFTPRWSINNDYILDDEYADIRKESIETGTPVQMYIEEKGEWVTMTPDMDFTLPIKCYRLKHKDKQIRR